MEGLGLREGEDWRSNHVVLSEICHHLDVDDILQFRLVNRDWYEASKPALNKKAVIKVNRSTPFIDQIGWARAGEEEDIMIMFDQFVSFVTNDIVDYQFENLELSWCPLMKNHTIWLQVAPKVKKLVVCRLHAPDICDNCRDEQDFLREVLTSFPNTRTLSLKDHLSFYVFDADSLDAFTFNVDCVLPAVNPETLKSVSIDAVLASLPDTFIASLFPHLECLELLSPSYGDGWVDFFNALNAILASVESKRFKKLDIRYRCQLTPDGSGIETLKNLFTKFSADNVLFWLADRTTETISEIYQWFPLPAKEVSFVFDVEEAEGDLLVNVVNDHLEQMAWNKISYRLKVSRGSDASPTTIWKRVSTESHVASLLVTSKLTLPSKKMMEVLPNATFLVICRAGRVVAEIFGSSNFLFPDMKRIVDTVALADIPGNKNHLIDVVEFRRFVGIADDWNPPELFERHEEHILIFFAIEPKLIDEVRIKLSSFIHPARKLKSTFQIVQAFEKGMLSERQGKAILSWVDPLCLRLASGESFIDGRSCKVIKA